MNSSDIIEYVRSHEYSISGEFRDCLEQCARYMFEAELWSANLNQNLSPAEIQCLKIKEKLQAVKLYKRRTSCNLMDAKNKIEDYMREHYGCTSFQK